MSDEPEAEWCSAVHLSPQQVNEIIEEKLTHLQPVLEGVLEELKRTRDMLMRLDASWRDLLERAKLAVS